VTTVEKTVPYHDMTPVRLRGAKMSVTIEETPNKNGRINFEIEVPVDVTEDEKNWIRAFLDEWMVELRKRFPFIGNRVSDRILKSGED
jgi:hypothetical protein